MESMGFPMQEVEVEVEVGVGEGHHTSEEEEWHLALTVIRQ
jgi:hypothetical protein